MRAAAGKTTRDRCLTRLPLRLLLQAQQRGASHRPQRCAREGAAGPRVWSTSSHRARRADKLPQKAESVIISVKFGL
ncbi:unnamed protein product [Rangifer tarandus platyrhynchus]|uniref:Uncharacterized protein n=1 Tax=Rangifer tarandus platyrhynchus TaxID=3082113 RepID=A0ABN9A582_RANTA|nr:unnamed protein product [Rangifer tarandus platyrhynchus]